ncbi:hypothetical protein ABIC86_004094 [Paenibacillus sp. DS2363]
MCPRLRIRFRLIAGTLYGRSTARVRSRLRHVRDRSPLPSARLQGQYRDALGFATFASGRHCLRLGSKVNTGTLSASPWSRQGRHCLRLGSKVNTGDALGFALIASGRHCLWLGSKVNTGTLSASPWSRQVAIAFGSAPRSTPERSRLRLDRDRSPLPLARLRGQHWGTLDSQLLSYKPFNQFQHFYQYRLDFKISTSLNIGRYQRFPYSTRERPIGRSLVTDPSSLEHMNELYLIQREVPATHREARQHAQTASFWLHLSSLPLGAE